MIDPNKDFYGWTRETAEKLRQGKFNEVNMEDLIEEVEDMGASVWRALDSRLTILLAHLLKWQYQPERQGRSWQLTIKEQRHQIAKLLRKNPSLKPELAATIAEAYPGAVIVAARETDKDENTFPATFEGTGWTWEQVLDMEFLPE
ncbi:protein of unknown function DUF29 [Nitrosococcus halophilus Nc 4]|uniref:DUF29 domain-containing protein n=1 Tax=Nitrosococcus halophilus (strain Nc4) TaxID=472759 RepID=D5C015_NITHN|nr:DUF29 domain-containing protein [Nitrosococcus halophilus]ADE16262.1 protein of unknown function DUF29 [Nitrosococcus halophilus Nc 4]